MCIIWSSAFADNNNISEAGGAIIGGATGYQIGEISKLPPTAKAGLIGLGGYVGEVLGKEFINNKIDQFSDYYNDLKTPKSKSNNQYLINEYPKYNQYENITKHYPIITPIIMKLK